MIRRLPRSTRTDTLCPYTTLFRSDFVASASRDRDQVSAGAVDLRPSRTWRVSVAYEHHFGKGGAIVVEARHESIADVVDHTILRDESGRIFDVVGNIGHGTRDTLSVDATLQLAPLLGIEGARIEEIGRAH